MPVRRARSPKDANTTATALVRGITGAEPVNGEKLLGSAESVRLYREAKARLNAKPRRK